MLSCWEYFQLGYAAIHCERWLTQDTAGCDDYLSFAHGYFPSRMRYPQVPRGATVHRGGSSQDQGQQLRHGADARLDAALVAALVCSLLLLHLNMVVLSRKGGRGHLTSCCKAIVRFALVNRGAESAGPAQVLTLTLTFSDLPEVLDF